MEDKKRMNHPELLIDQIVRNRIFSNIYWKEECHGLNGILYKTLRGDIS